MIAELEADHAALLRALATQDADAIMHAASRMHATIATMRAAKDDPPDAAALARGEALRDAIITTRKRLNLMAESLRGRRESLAGMLGHDTLIAYRMR